jgi:NRPS condensation-like uncharacterized protein
LNNNATIPATMPVEFVECTIRASCEFEYYRPQLGGILALDGRLDETRLSRALRLLLDAEPVLGCRFDAEATLPAWRRIGGLDRVNLLDVRDSATPADEAAKFIAEDFDLNGGPQMIAALVRGPSSDTLAVKVSHVAMDGGALKETLYLIGEYYRRLAEHPDWTPMPNLDGLRQPAADAGLFEKLRLLPKSGIEITPPSDWVVPVLGGRGPASFVSSSVEPEVFRTAALEAKSAGATVNDVLVTALYRTLYRVLDAGPGSRAPLLLTCELRRHLPAGTKTALSNISSVWTVDVPPVAGEGFDGTLARVVGATRAWKSSGASKAIAIGIPIVNKVVGRRALGFFRGQFSKTEKNISDQPGGDVVGFTNIGVIDEERLDFGVPTPVTDAWLLGPVIHSGAGLAASTYRDRLHLVSGVEFAAIDERLVTDIVEGTARDLEGWIAARTSDELSQ